MRIELHHRRVRLENDVASQLDGDGTPARTVRRRGPAARGPRAVKDVASLSPAGGLYVSLLLGVHPRGLPAGWSPSPRWPTPRPSKRRRRRGGLKWPNDLWVGRRKVGGILLERGTSDGPVDPRRRPQPARGARGPARGRARRDRRRSRSGHRARAARRICSPRCWTASISGRTGARRPMAGFPGDGLARAHGPARREAVTCVHAGRAVTGLLEDVSLEPDCCSVTQIRVLYGVGRACAGSATGRPYDLLSGPSAASPRTCKTSAPPPVGPRPPSSSCWSCSVSSCSWRSSGSGRSRPSASATTRRPARTPSPTGARCSTRAPRDRRQPGGHPHAGAQDRGPGPRARGQRRGVAHLRAVHGGQAARPPHPRRMAGASGGRRLLAGRPVPLCGIASIASRSAPGNSPGNGRSRTSARPSPARPTNAAGPSRPSGLGHARGRTRSGRIRGTRGGRAFVPRRHGLRVRLVTLAAEAAGVDPDGMPPHLARDVVLRALEVESLNRDRERLNRNSCAGARELTGDGASPREPAGGARPGAEVGARPVPRYQRFVADPNTQAHPDADRAQKELRPPPALSSPRARAARRDPPRRSSRGGRAPRGLQETARLIRDNVDEDAATTRDRGALAPHPDAEHRGHRRARSRLQLDGRPLTCPTSSRSSRSANRAGPRGRSRTRSSGS